MTLAAVTHADRLTATARPGLVARGAGAGRLSSALATARVVAVACGARAFSQVLAPGSRAFVLGANSAGAGVTGHAACAPVGGALALPDARTILADLTATVTNVTFPAFSGDRRIVVYLRQDASGGRAVAGWPASVQWPGAEAPELSTTPHAIDCLIFDVMDGGSIIFGNLVGASYGPT